MTRAIMKRIEKLERVAPASVSGKGHWIIVERLEDPAPKIADLHASPEWEDGDHITVWRVVDPKAMRAEQ